MKVLEKIALYLFSIIVLVISVVAIFLAFKWVEAATIFGVILSGLENFRNVILVVSIVCILLALKAMFFSGDSSKSRTIDEGVLLENSEGKLLISKSTIENLVNRVVAGFDSAAKVETRVELDESNNVTVYVELAVKEDAVIKELSNNLQLKIKESIKKASDLDVKEVNISVSDIEPNKEGTIE